MLSCDRRRGLTLVELLVVIVILVLIVALLLPAVQMLRAASARAGCQNNFKQIGLALQNYHGSNNRLPSGLNTDSRKAPYPRSGWLLRLLPYVERDDLWQQAVTAFAADRDTYHNPPHTGLSAVVTLYTCPSDPRLTEAHDTVDGRFGPCSYLGCEGIDVYNRNGVLSFGSLVRFDDITDGTSMTLAAGERPPGPDFHNGLWYTGDGLTGFGALDVVLGVREATFGLRGWAYCPSAPAHFGPGRLDEPCDVFHYWSLHPGGGNFLFCDGSVRFLAYSADPLLPALATRAADDAAVLPD